jgi:hypothetical protein
MERVRYLIRLAVVLLLDLEAKVARGHVVLRHWCHHSALRLLIL